MLIIIGLVLKVFRKPRPGDRTADRAALADWEAMYLGRQHAQPTFDEREPGHEQAERRFDEGFGDTGRDGSDAARARRRDPGWMDQAPL